MPFNGTGTGSQPIYATGASGFGQCLNFNANGTITMAPDSSQSASYSVSVRFNTAVGTQFAALISLGGNGNADGITLNGLNTIQFSISGFQNTNVTFTYGDSAWHTYALCFDHASTNGYCFIDGTLVGTITGGSSSANDQCKQVGSTGLIGLVDEVQWSNTTCYHTTGYTAPTAPFSNTAANQDALWHFDGNLNDTNGVTLQTGTLVRSGVTATTETITTGVATGGTIGSGYSYQFQVAPNVNGSAGTYTNFGIGASAIVQKSTGLAPGTGYWFDCVVSDSGGNVSTSSAILGYTLGTSEVVIEFIGDSITMGYQNTSPPFQNPVIQCQYDLEAINVANNGGVLRNILTLNEGIVGSATKDWLPGTANYNTALGVGMSIGVQTCAICLGANDNLQGVLVTQYQANMQSIITGLVGSGIGVILNCLPYINGSGSTATIQSYNNVLLNLGNQVGVRTGDIYAYNIFGTNQQTLGGGNAGSFLQSDNLHPTPIGDMVLGALWASGVSTAYNLTFNIPASSSPGVSSSSNNGSGNYNVGFALFRKV